MLTCRLTCKWLAGGNMANTRFFLDTRSAKNGNSGILKLAIAHQKRTAYIALDVKLDPEKQWNGKEIISHPNLFVVKTYINGVKNKVDNIILQLQNNGSINSKG